MGGRNPSRNISYVKQDEPTFLKNFKERVGFVEGPNVDTKREKLPELGDSDGEDEADERPTVVVLKKGDLTQEEADNFLQHNQAEDAGTPTTTSTRGSYGPTPREPDVSAKVVFKKPTKRSSTEENDLNVSSSKKKKENSKDNCDKKKQIKAVKNRNLLSFGDDEDDEDDDV